ncbi:hypothetical protein GCM10009764_39880 [Nocardia ninae]|uniref:Uncharacterized protein n=1 Tax=Nocardia ninae NBRC 108245 TaxID=1210091 RepID=A0A511MHL7_9NOCA|nr:hypothetical protein NN4_46830 [Nocardia ninae NBRC 108245]
MLSNRIVAEWGHQHSCKSASLYHCASQPRLPQCPRSSGELSDVWSRGVVIGVGLDIHGDLQQVGIGIGRAHQLHADG